MALTFTIKDHIRETRIFTNRVTVAFVIICLASAAMLARLIYLQVIGHEHFTTLSLDNRVSIVPLPPTRGLIYDRNGVLLAQNVPTFSLEIIPEQVTDLDQTLNQLATLIPITDDDLLRFHKLRRKKPRFESIPLRFRLTDQEVASFAVNRHRFPGVDIAARLMRNYPLGPTGVHIVGYVGRINEDELQTLDSSDYRGTSHVGKTGVEKSYEDTLHGTVGVQQVEVNALGRTLRALQTTPPSPGKDLYLTIDSYLQAVAEAAMAGRRGSIVAIEPATGDILALVSTPTYDPNMFVVGIDAKSYDALQSSPDEPLFNRALRGRYPPGSTIKPFVGLAGLENDKATMDSRLYCPGWYSLRNDSHRYRDWKRGGHGVVAMHAAIVESCDVYFYDLALNLGIDNIHSFLGQFGFGKQTGVDISGELSGLLPSREWKQAALSQPWYPGETLIVGIGQGYALSTPLQLALATATLANGGNILKPRVVGKLHDASTDSVTPLDPVRTGTVFLKNPENLDTIVAAMIDVVHGRAGTAKGIGKDAPYIIAGKTGTAQVFGIKQDEKYVAEDLDERLLDHALFIAFAPAENPQIAVAVIVENGGSGGATAAPVARQVMDYYLLHRKSSTAG